MKPSYVRRKFWADTKEQGWRFSIEVKDTAPGVVVDLNVIASGYAALAGTAAFRFLNEHKQEIENIIKERVASAFSTLIIQYLQAKTDIKALEEVRKRLPAKHIWAPEREEELIRAHTELKSTAKKVRETRAKGLYADLRQFSEEDVSIVVPSVSVVESEFFIQPFISPAVAASHLELMKDLLGLALNNIKTAQAFKTRVSDAQLVFRTLLEQKVIEPLKIEATTKASKDRVTITLSRLSGKFGYEKGGEPIKPYIVVATVPRLEDLEFIGPSELAEIALGKSKKPLTSLLREYFSLSAFKEVKKSTKASLELFQKISPNILYTYVPSRLKKVVLYRTFSAPLPYSIGKVLSAYSWITENPVAFGIALIRRAVKQNNLELALDEFLRLPLSDLVIESKNVLSQLSSIEVSSGVQSIDETCKDITKNVNALSDFWDSAASAIVPYFLILRPDVCSPDKIALFYGVLKWLFREYSGVEEKQVKLIDCEVHQYLRQYKGDAYFFQMYLVLISTFTGEVLAFDVYYRTLILLSLALLGIVTEGTLYDLEQEIFDYVSDTLAKRLEFLGCPEKYKSIVKDVAKQRISSALAFSKVGTIIDLIRQVVSRLRIQDFVPVDKIINSLIEAGEAVPLEKVTGVAEFVKEATVIQAIDPIVRAAEVIKTCLASVESISTALDYLFENMPWPAEVSPRRDMLERWHKQARLASLQRIRLGVVEAIQHAMLSGKPVDFRTLLDIDWSGLFKQVQGERLYETAEREATRFFAFAKKLYDGVYNLVYLPQRGLARRFWVKFSLFGGHKKSLSKFVATDPDTLRAVSISRLSSSADKMVVSISMLSAERVDVKVRDLIVEGKLTPMQLTKLGTLLAEYSRLSGYFNKAQAAAIMKKLLDAIPGPLSSKLKDEVRKDLVSWSDEYLSGKLRGEFEVYSEMLGSLIGELAGERIKTPIIRMKLKSRKLTWGEQARYLEKMAETDPSFAELLEKVMSPGTKKRQTKFYSFLKSGVSYQAGEVLGGSDRFGKWKVTKDGKFEYIPGTGRFANIFVAREDRDPTLLIEFRIPIGVEVSAPKWNAPSKWEVKGWRCLVFGVDLEVFRDELVSYPREIEPWTLKGPVKWMRKKKKREEPERLVLRLKSLEVNYGELYEQCVQAALDIPDRKNKLRELWAQYLAAASFVASEEVYDMGHRVEVEDLKLFVCRASTLKNVLVRHYPDYFKIPTIKEVVKLAPRRKEVVSFAEALSEVQEAIKYYGHPYFSSALSGEFSELVKLAQVYKVGESLTEQASELLQADFIELVNRNPKVLNTLNRFVRYIKEGRMLKAWAYLIALDHTSVTSEGVLGSTPMIKAIASQVEKESMATGGFRISVGLVRQAVSRKMMKGEVIKPVRVGGEPPLKLVTSVLTYPYLKVDPEKVIRSAVDSVGPLILKYYLKHTRKVEEAYIKDAFHYYYRSYIEYSRESTARMIVSDVYQLARRLRTLEAALGGRVEGVRGIINMLYDLAPTLNKWAKFTSAPVAITAWLTNRIIMQNLAKVLFLKAGGPYGSYFTRIQNIFIGRHLLAPMMVTRAAFDVSRMYHSLTDAVRLRNFRESLEQSV